MVPWIRCGLGLAVLGACVGIAGALAWGAESDDERIAKLIVQLGNDSEPTRNTAETQLYVIGGPALRQLNTVIRTTDNAEVRRRAQRLVRKIMFLNWPLRGGGQEFLLVKPGEFSMGSPANEKDRRGDELQHDVKITRAFYIARREVTQAEYNGVMNARPSWFSPTGEGRDRLRNENTGSFPVDSVSWFDAIEYCNRLSRTRGFAEYYSITNIRRKDETIVAAEVKIRGGAGFRLPTEAEWEYVCRAGTETTHHFGTLPKNSRRGKRGNFQYSVMTRNYGLGYHTIRRTTTVGDYTANPWGVYDMHGNVAEWCWDRYDKAYYAKSPKNDPTGPADGDRRVLRGGSFLSTQPNCRSATRFSSLPSEAKYYIGFRVARTAAEQEKKPPARPARDF